MKKKLCGTCFFGSCQCDGSFTGCGSSDNQSKDGVDKKVQIEYLACSLRKLRRYNG